MSGYDRGGGGGGYDSRGGGGRGGAGGYGGGGRGGGGGYGGGGRGGGGGGGGGGYGGGRGGGGGRDGGSRDGDWTCPDPSCGNVNFARRTECNKCRTSNPTATNKGNTGGHGDGGYNRSGGGGGGGGGYNRGGGRDYNSGGDRGGDRGGGGGGDRYDRSRSGGDRHDRNRTDSGSYSSRDRDRDRDGSYNSRDRDTTGGYGGQDGNFSQVPPPAQQPSYPDPYGVNNSYNSVPAPVPQGYGSYPPPAGGGYAAPAPAGGYERGGREPQVEAPPAKVKQCDENCGDTCDNARIYISNLPPDVSVDELQELFGGIGLVGRIKQKRGYKDQWPYNIKIYTDDNGKNKGDACLAYEDPSAAHSASGFYNNYDMRGHKISVVMAEKSAPKPQASYGGHGGGRGGGGDRRRDGGGPDRHFGGGHRSKPY